MATVIYPSPIFGPVHSRRLGVSLGINLLPEERKKDASGRREVVYVRLCVL